MPRPALPARLTGRLAVLDRTWSRFVEPHRRDGHGDFEGWVEMAERLTSAREVFGDQLAINSASPQDAHLPDVGVAYGRHNVRPDASAASADDYARTASFAALAGRRTWITSDVEADAVIAQIHARGRDAYVKSMRAKAMVATRVPVGHSLVEALDAAFEAATGEPGVGACALMSVMDEPEGLLVQEACTMRYEYRCWVVDGTVIMGAGAIEQMTPLDSRGARFDDLVAEHRGRSLPKCQPEVLATLLCTAIRFARMARAEVPEMSEYVVDVALDAEGSGLVVELNSWQNAGLYASQPRFLYEALAGRQHFPARREQVTARALLPLN